MLSWMNSTDGFHNINREACGIIYLKWIENISNYLINISNNLDPWHFMSLQCQCPIIKIKMEHLGKELGLFKFLDIYIPNVINILSIMFGLVYGIHFSNYYGMSANWQTVSSYE